MTARLIVMVVGAALLVATTHAAAQPAEDAAASQPPSILDATIDLFGAVDEGLGTSAAEAPGGRTYWGANSNLLYERRLNRVAFGATLGTSVRRFETAEDGLIPSYSGSARLTGPFGRRAQWSLDQSLSYGPANVVPFFIPGDMAQGVQTLPLVDYRISNQNRLSTDSRGSVSYDVSRRGSLSGRLGYQHAAAPGSAEQTDGSSFQRWSAGAGYLHRASRYLSLSVGYGITQNGFTSSESPVGSPYLHSIDSGVSYSRPLSFSRRTRISTQLGSSVLQSRDSGARQWRANGTFVVQHELGRTWQAQLAYRRSTGFVPAFSDPVLSDNVTVNLAGNLSRASSLGLLANYSTGSVGISTGENSYRMVSTSASYRYAFLRRMAAYVEYFLFDLRFASGVALADTLFNESRRHGVRVGISVGTGLWGNPRHLPAPENGDRQR